MNRLRCGPLAAWATAWLAGTAAFDDVLSAASVGAVAPALALTAPLIAGGPRRGSSHGSAGDGRPAPLGEILIAWRQARAQVRLTLPVPGDVRGLPGPAAFRSAAIDAGQAVVGTLGAGSGTGAEPRIGVVPVVVDHRPSSAPPSLHWCRFEIEAPVEDAISVADAQYELSEAIRECASTIARMDLQDGLRADGSSAGLTDDLSAARRAGERINLPPGFPPKAVSLVAQAERMAAVLSLAGVGTPATDAGRDEQRAHALAPLVTAVRRARLAGYNAAA